MSHGLQELVRTTRDSAGQVSAGHHFSRERLAMSQKNFGGMATR